MALLIVVWKKSDDIFSLGWPWIMSIVSLCVIGVLLGLHSLMVSIRKYCKFNLYFYFIV